MNPLSFLKSLLAQKNRLPSLRFWENSYSLKRFLAEGGAWCLRQLPPEMAHNLGLQLLRSPYFYRHLPGIPPSSVDLSVPFPIGTHQHHRLAHPIGLAAGYDKNGAVLTGLSKLGFSFMEVGTLTPRAQLGNPTPRIFRLSERRELINSMGFPNLGMNTAKTYLENFNHKLGGWVGINIGKNLITPQDHALEDYLSVLQNLKDQGHYFVINVSSPNTAGLRSLAHPTFFEVLAERISSLESGLLTKTWIKLDPDSSPSDFQQNIQSILAKSFAGVILCNTHAVRRPYKGGLSGSSLRSFSLQRLALAREVHEGHLPMIAVGGISTGSDVLQALMLGACCVQIYTALVYRGPWAVIKILQELEEEMSLQGLTSLSELPHLR